MTPDQVRAGKQDFDAVTELDKQLPGGLPPLVYCLNKVDTHMAPTDTWPPEENATLAGDIVDNLDFIASYLEQDNPTPYRPSSPFKGYTFDSTEHVGVFPTCARAGSEWNIDTLAELIGGHLPDEALLQFAQAQRREQIMQSIARQRTNKVAKTAGTIAGIDVSGISDIMVLTPMQVYLVMVIGALSCQEFSIDRAREYFAELGAISGAGLGARKIAGALTGIVGPYGAAINATVAASTTYMIGRSAESYFFDDEYVKPKEFREDAKELFTDIS